MGEITHFIAMAFDLPIMVSSLVSPLSVAAPQRRSSEPRAYGKRSAIPGLWRSSVPAIPYPERPCSERSAACRMISRLNKPLARLNQNHLAEPDHDPRRLASPAFRLLGLRSLRCDGLDTAVALWPRAECSCDQCPTYGSNT